VHAPQFSLSPSHYFLLDLIGNVLPQSPPYTAKLTFRVPAGIPERAEVIAAASVASDCPDAARDFQAFAYLQVPTSAPYVQRCMPTISSSLGCTGMTISLTMSQTNFKAVTDVSNFGGPFTAGENVSEGCFQTTYNVTSKCPLVSNMFQTTVSFPTPAVPGPFRGLANLHFDIIAHSSHRQRKPPFLTARKQTSIFDC
jgi:hypothetical protein